VWGTTMVARFRPIRLAGVEFKSRAVLKARLKSILKDGSISEPDQYWLKTMVVHTHKADVACRVKRNEKFHVVIQNVQVIGASASFHIAFDDGPRVELGYKKWADDCFAALSGEHADATERMKESRHRKDLQKAFRFEVECQTMKYKLTKASHQNTFECDGCSTTGFATSEVEVHHSHEDFSKIRDAFMDREGTDSPPTVVSHPERRDGHCFSDRDLAERWREFHKASSTFELLCKQCHARITRRAS